MLASRSQKLILKHIRCFGTVSTKVSGGVDSLASPAYQFSIWDTIFKSSTMPQVPLNEPFPTAETAKGYELLPYNNESQVSELDNGMRVISLESPVPFCSIGVFCEAGSAWENPKNIGVSHFLEKMAFKSTHNRSSYAFDVDMQAIGASVECAASREFTTFSAEVLPRYVPAVVSAFGDVIQNGSFPTEDLNSAVTKYKQMLSEASNHPEIQLVEGIHEASYVGSPLGYNRFCQEHQLGRFTKEFLQEHVKNTFTGPRMVLAAVGVGHTELVALAKDAFSGIGDKSEAKPDSVYTGGESRVQADIGGLVHIAVGHESAGLHSDEILTQAVLMYLMGGGGSFSAGGPGKGMYSRLYDSLVSANSWVMEANCYTHYYTNSSLFGIHGVVEGSRAPDMVSAMQSELKRMAGPLNEGELQRAKNTLKSALHMATELRKYQLETLGIHTLVYNEVQSTDHAAEKVDAITEDDIQRVAGNMLETPLSIASYGAVEHVPRL